MDRLRRLHVSPMQPLSFCSFGERFEFGRHPQGTEVKAITYSAMQILTPHHAYTANDAADADAASTAAARASLEQDAATAVESAAVGVVLPAASARAVSDAEPLKPTAAVVSTEGLAGIPSRARRAPYEVFVIVDI